MRFKFGHFSVRKRHFPSKMKGNTNKIIGPQFITKKSLKTLYNLLKPRKKSIIKAKEIVYLATNRGVGEKNASKKYKLQDKPR